MAYSIVLFSCSTVKGSFLGSEKILNSEKEISNKIFINVIRQPTNLDPTLNLSITQKPTFQVLYKTKYEQKKVVNPWIKWPVILTTLGGLIAWIWATDKPGQTGGAITFGAGIVLVGSILTVQSNRGEVYDKSYYETEEGKEMNLYGNHNATVIFNGIKKDYSLLNSNRLNINLLSDFNCSKTYAEKMDLIIYVDNKKNENIFINSNDFLIQYIKIITKNAEVLGEYNNETITLGNLNIGEEYRLVHKGSLLWKIDYNGKEGYIQPNSGEIFWAIADYLK